MLTSYIGARLQERSEDLCVCVCACFGVYVLWKGSKKAWWGSWKTRSLICSPPSCKKGLLTQMLQQLFEVMVMFLGLTVVVSKNPESPFIQPSKVLAEPYKTPSWNNCVLWVNSRTRKFESDLVVVPSYNFIFEVYVIWIGLVSSLDSEKFIFLNLFSVERVLSEWLSEGF